MKSRRDALITLAAGVLAPAVQGQHQHGSGEPVPPVGKAPKNLSAAEFEQLSKLVDLIIPRTDTPGASDAGVPMYIDRVCERRPETKAALEAGLAKLGPDVQADTLSRMEQEGDPFFKLIKDLTIDGYYTSKEGLVQELGYHGNTYLREFKGCTHPEHMGEGHAD